MQQEVYIAQMTCSACEKHVGESLSAIKGVTSVRVKWRKGHAVLEVARPVSRAQIKHAIEEAGYKLGTRPPKWVNSDRNIWRDFAVGFAITVAVLIFLRIIGVLDLVSALDPSTSGQIFNVNTILVVVVLGVVASVSTCMALVGGLVLGVSAAYSNAHRDASHTQLMLPQVLFNFGRVVGFALLGGLLGAVGNIIVPQGIVLTVVTAAIAIIMFVLGVRLSEVSPRIATWQIVLPSKVTRLIRRTEKSEIDKTGHFHPTKPLLLGAASFFLPCGFTQAVQVFALATGKPLWAGIIMMSFAIGTTPGLLGVGFLSSLAQKRVGKRLFHTLGVVVIVFSLMNLNGAIAPYFPLVSNITSAVSSVFGDLRGGGDTSTITSNVKVAADGMSQTAEIQVTGTGYSPRNTVVEANVPLKLTFKKGSVSCAASINVRGLGSGYDIVQAFNSDAVLDLNLKPGTYNYACAMGMYTGKITAISSPSDSKEQNE
jgi:sulfite exporter TauE/SafE/copper chaperone CopZ